MTFKEYYLEKNKKNEEFETIVDDTYIPITYVGDDDYGLSDYCIEKYGKLLDSECEIIKKGDNKTTEVVEIFCDDYKMGEQFAYACAGYCSVSETEKLFPELSKNDDIFIEREVNGEKHKFVLTRQELAVIGEKLAYEEYSQEIRCYCEDMGIKLAPGYREKLIKKYSESRGDNDYGGWSDCIDSCKSILDEKIKQEFDERLNESDSAEFIQNLAAANDEQFEELKKDRDFRMYAVEIPDNIKRADYTVFADNVNGLKDAAADCIYQSFKDSLKDHCYIFSRISAESEPTVYCQGRCRNVTFLPEWKEMRKKFISENDSFDGTVSVKYEELSIEDNSKKNVFFPNKLQLLVLEKYSDEFEKYTSAEKITVEKTRLYIDPDKMIDKIIRKGKRAHETEPTITEKYMHGHYLLEGISGISEMYIEKCGWKDPYDAVRIMSETKFDAEDVTSINVHCIDDDGKSSFIDLTPEAMYVIYNRGKNDPIAYSYALESYEKLKEYAGRRNSTIPIEPNLFCSDENVWAAPARIGCMRADFGLTGKEFRHTWSPAKSEYLNNNDFKKTLGEVVEDCIGSGMLKDLPSMQKYCSENAGTQIHAFDNTEYGFVRKTDDYTFCIRCDPTPGNYNCYCYAYSNEILQKCSEKHRGQDQAVSSGRGK